MKTKKFDAVKLMRTIRDKFSKKYYKNVDKLYADLAVIRKKYHLDEQIN